MTSANVVVASSIFVTWGYPDLPAASALAVLMVIGLMALVIPVQILAFRRADDR
jgi:iron(III) transport system permease protein